MAVHFIADVHLQPRGCPLTEVLCRYLAGPARTAEALYILGDLFEYWVGDDGSLRDYPETVAALRQLTDAGVPVFFVHGNRDFGVGHGFAAATGTRLLRDPSVIDLGGTRVALTHGDRLCTDDTRHQRFRARYNDPAWRRRMLALPVILRRAIARYARLHSQWTMRRKAPPIMDVNAEAVAAFMREQEVALLIHGHTHRPADHDFYIDGKPARRLVLSDWRAGQGEVLVCGNNGWQRQILQ